MTQISMLTKSKIKALMLYNSHRSQKLNLTSKPLCLCRPKRFPIMKKEKTSDEKAKVDLADLDVKMKQIIEVATRSAIDSANANKADISAKAVYDAA